MLVGLYLSPGLLFALPKGAIARTFGDKRVVLAGVALMVLGGMVSAISTHWEAQLAGRFLARMGGVVINALMSKMITDWFAGREIATAMALFVNSWRAGIGLALLVQPHVAAVGGVPLVLWRNRDQRQPAPHCFAGVDRDRTKAERSAPDVDNCPIRLAGRG